MIILKTTPLGLESLPSKELPPDNFFTPLQLKLLRHLLSKQDYPRNIAAKLNLHEQNVYYHIKQLTRRGMLKRIIDQQSPIGYSYIVAEPSFVLRLAPFRETHKLEGVQKESSFLNPFIHDGKLDAKMIVGSPDPHGPQKARSRDGYYGMDFALFLGTFLNYVPTSMVKLDTEIRDADLKEHLVLLGGPVVNHVMERVNERLAIRFENGTIYSTVTQNHYNADECAMILKTQNPFAKDKMMLVIAGIRHAGTRAGIISFLKHFDEVKLPNTKNPKLFGHVVEGVDTDSDGMVDEVEFLE